MSESTPNEVVERFGADIARVKDEVGKMIVGQDDIVDGVLTCLLAGGQALLEGVPGLGKTMLVRTLANALQLDFARIQFTPDLMPADILGTTVLTEGQDGSTRLEFRKGPVFANIVLADEINRATPKTQSAMLEVMQEHTVTVSNKTYVLDEPYFVLATQNPLEMEGTYPLPEAQLDRFLFKIFVPSPDEDTLVGILEATTGTAKATVPRVVDGPTILAMRELVREVRVAGALTRYVARFVRASDPSTEAAAPAARELLRYGAGVRGAQAMLLAAKVVALMDGRAHVAFADLRRVALPALRHRLIPNFEAEADGISTDQIVTRLLDEVPEVSDGVATLAS